MRQGEKQGLSWEGCPEGEGSWRRRLGAAGRIGGEPGENHEEVTEVKTGIDSVQGCKRVRPDMDLSGHWASVRRPLTSAAAAALLQSCPTLCDPLDGSPPGSPVPGILQARTLEWVAISFSIA